jgi:hypothetical protein|tara:strand:+ start:643 stop:969 length:327 start_codon:yes stop_codon:yes gene_type:complete
MNTSITEKDYLPTTAKELSDQQELVSLVAKMVNLYNHGLNEGQKQMLRDMYAELKGENKNQPDWTGTNYLELMLEMVYMRGCAFGHIKGMSQMHSSYSSEIKNVFKRK